MTSRGDLIIVTITNLSRVIQLSNQFSSNFTRTVRVLLQIRVLYEYYQTAGNDQRIRYISLMHEIISRLLRLHSSLHARTIYIVIRYILISVCWTLLLLLLDIANSGTIWYITTTPNYVWSLPVPGFQQVSSSHISIDYNKLYKLLVLQTMGHNKSHYGCLRVDYASQFEKEVATARLGDVSEYNIERNEALWKDEGWERISCERTYSAVSSREVARNTASIRKAAGTLRLAQNIRMRLVFEQNTITAWERNAVTGSWPISRGGS